MKRLITAVMLMIGACGVSDEYPANYEERIEQKIIELQNADRQKKLYMDVSVNIVARNHSENMSRKSNLSHDGFPHAREHDYKRLFPEYKMIYVLAENVAKLSKYGQSAELVASESIKAWMRSASHRKNIVNQNYSKTGIGVFVDDRHIWITQIWFK